MAVLRVRNEDGTWAEIPAIVGPSGAPGYTPQKGVDYTDGLPGVGIASVEQTTKSAEDDGVNIITVTLDDGRTYSFEVQNGSKGGKGAGDMEASVYDPQGKKQDVFAYVDTHVADKADKSDIPAVVTPNAVVKQFALSTSADTVASNSTFEEKTKASSDRMRGCAYGKGTFVTVGLNGAIQYSEDGGNTWALADSPTTGVIVSLAYGKGVFVAGVSGTNEIINSIDGKTWNVVGTFTDGYPSGIVYGNGRFIAIGENFLAMSTDGKTFKKIDSFIDGDYNDVAYGNGKYIAVTSTGKIVTSVNGEDWKDVSIEGDTTHYRTVAYSGAVDRFVIGGAGGIIRYSDDAVNWNTATTDSTSTISYIRDFTYCEGVFYACMYTSSGGGEVWTSKDGAAWHVAYTSTGRMWCICNGEDKVLVSGETGRVYVLDLGISWLGAEPTIAKGQYLWERTLINLSDGDTVTGDPLLMTNTKALATENWTFTLEDGSTVTKEVYVG